MVELAQIEKRMKWSLIYNVMPYLETVQELMDDGVLGTNLEPTCD